MGSPYLFEEELTYLRRSYYLQMLSTYLGIRKDIKRVITSTCNDFEMWRRHSTELKTKLFVNTCPVLCARTPALICFMQEASEYGDLKISTYHWSENKFGRK